MMKRSLVYGTQGDIIEHFRPILEYNVCYSTTASINMPYGNINNCKDACYQAATDNGCVGMLTGDPNQTILNATNCHCVGILSAESVAYGGAIHLPTGTLPNGTKVNEPPPPSPPPPPPPPPPKPLTPDEIASKICSTNTIFPSFQGATNCFAACEFGAQFYGCQGTLVGNRFQTDGMCTCIKKDDPKNNACSTGVSLSKNKSSMNCRAACEQDSKTYGCQGTLTGDANNSSDRCYCLDVIPSNICKTSRVLLQDAPNCHTVCASTSAQYGCPGMIGNKVDGYSTNGVCYCRG